MDKHDMYLESGDMFTLGGSEYTFHALVLRDGLWYLEAREGEPDECHLLALEVVKPSQHE